MKYVGISLLLIALINAMSGCNRTACDRVLECTIGEENISDAMLDECQSNLDDVEAGCRSAYRSWARCLDQSECDVLDCREEAEELSDECEEGPPFVLVTD